MMVQTWKIGHMSERPSSATVHEEEEVTLVQLVIALWQQKWVIVGVTVVCVIAGTGYALTKPAIFEYSTTIEIGTQLEGDDPRPIEPPENVVSKLERNYIPEAIRTYEQELLESNGGETRRLQVDARQPNGTNLVVLTSEAPEELAEYYIRLHGRVVERLAADHQRDAKLDRVRVENQLEEAKLRLEELTDERVLKVERQEIQNRITAEKNKLESLSDQQELLQTELENLEVQDELVEKRLKQLSDYIADARERRSRAQNEVQGGSEGMALMLIDNELQRDIDRQTELEERLMVEIPEKRADLRSKLENNQREQLLQRETISALEALYEKLLIDQERRLPEARARVAELETRLQNLRETRAVLPPRQSLNAVGTSSRLIIVLSLVLGGMLGLFAAMVASFVGHVRQKLAEQ